MSSARLLQAIACAGAVVAISACTEEANYPVVDDVYPAECIATTSPVFFDGVPAYWCEGIWYYREPGGRWAHYAREPEELYRRRIEALPARRTYEHPAPVPRPPGPPPGNPRPEHPHPPGHL
jgi:hypothetical protein